MPSDADAAAAMVTLGGGVLGFLQTAGLQALERETYNNPVESNTATSSGCTPVRLIADSP
jgi:hypothetical protein